MSPREELLRRAYAAFNARDVDGALALMHLDVDWQNGMEGGRVHGHDAVRAYWKRQFESIDSKVEPETFEELSDERMSVRVHQRVRTPAGELLSDAHVTHVYEFAGDQVTRMEIA